MVLLSGSMRFGQPDASGVGPNDHGMLICE